MYSFLISLCALILGYILYGKFIDKVFGSDPNRITPAVEKNDGFDFVPMPAWKIFLIQFINIAGTGPIFGAIMGAKFGPASYLWIVFGCIFAGAVHDYLSGMISLRNGGAAIPDIVGKYLGTTVKKIMLVFCVLLLLLVGAVFVYSPALILRNIAGFMATPEQSFLVWAAIIFIYYLVDTMLPVDKVIGKIFPIFGATLIVTAIALGICLFIKWPSLPEIWDGLAIPTEGGVKGQQIFPCLFITIACGAISGFHSTQTPLMARCLTNEKQGRPIFYGAMITEGIIALIWASISSYFFFRGGAAEVGSNISAEAPTVVETVAKSWLGVAGGILAILGVVFAPVTSGDTALRSARMIIADSFHIDQKKKIRRLYLAIPIFILVGLLLWFNISNEDGFNNVWRYFGWANQTLACFILWMETMYLVREKHKMWYMLTMIPACFMTSVCVSYISISKIGFNLPEDWAAWIGVTTFLFCLIVFYAKKLKSNILANRRRLSDLEEQIAHLQAEILKLQK